MPYPLIFRKSYGEKLKLFPNLLCHFTKRFGTRAFERHPVSTTLAEIKLIYYTSIKQREHNFRCQIIFLKTGIIVPINHALHAYIPFQLAVNSSQARINYKDKILLPFEQIL